MIEAHNGMLTVAPFLHRGVPYHLQAQLLRGPAGAAARNIDFWVLVAQRQRMRLADAVLIGDIELAFAAEQAPAEAKELLNDMLHYTATASCLRYDGSFSIIHNYGAEDEHAVPATMRRYRGIEDFCSIATGTSPVVLDACVQRNHGKELSAGCYPHVKQGKLSVRPVVFSTRFEEFMLSTGFRNDPYQAIGTRLDPL